MSYVEITVNHDAYVRANFPERPENWKPLNLAQANALFEKHAVLVSASHDGIYFPEANRLFGWRACDRMLSLSRAMWLEKNVRYGVYGYGEHSCFTRTGVNEMVRMLNEECYEEAGKALHAADVADLHLEDERDNAEEEAKKQARREKAAKRKAAKLAAEQAARAAETSEKEATA